MQRYSIRDLEKLSGISSHSIRIWERRYHLLKPSRTKTNIRYYSNHDLRKLLNISVLSNHGMKISHISQQSDNQLHDKVMSLMENREPGGSAFESYINSMLGAALEFDEQQFEIIWANCVRHFGMHEAMTTVIYPLLNRVGLMWSVEKMNPAQEHFLSCLVERKLMAGISELELKYQGKQCWILFLHEEEDHKIPLLFAHYLLRSCGIKTIYLGARVPNENLKQTIQACKPTHLLTFFTTQRPKLFFTRYLKEVKTMSHAAQIFIGGRNDLLSDLKLPESVERVESVEDFVRITKTSGKLPTIKKIKSNER